MHAACPRRCSKHARATAFSITNSPASTPLHAPLPPALPPHLPWQHTPSPTPAPCLTLQVDDVEKILSAVEDSSTVQTLLFSATMPHWVKDLTRKFLKPNVKMVDLIGDDKIKAATTVGAGCCCCCCTGRCCLWSWFFCPCAVPMASSCVHVLATPQLRCCQIPRCC